MDTFDHWWRTEGYALAIGKDTARSIWDAALSAAPTPPEFQPRTLIYGDVSAIAQTTEEVVDYIDRGYMLLDHIEDKLDMVGAFDEFKFKINQWAKAYPLDVFPEPDFIKASKVLKSNGITIDEISASNMRHVITRVKKMLDEVTLPPPSPTGDELRKAAEEAHALLVEIDQQVTLTESACEVMDDLRAALNKVQS